MLGIEFIEIQTNAFIYKRAKIENVDENIRKGHQIVPL